MLKTTSLDLNSKWASHSSSPPLSVDTLSSVEVSHLPLYSLMVRSTVCQEHAPKVASKKLAENSKQQWKAFEFIEYSEPFNAVLCALSYQRLANNIDNEFALFITRPRSILADDSHENDFRFAASIYLFTESQAR